MDKGGCGMCKKYEHKRGLSRGTVRDWEGMGGEGGGM